MPGLHLRAWRHNVWRGLASSEWPKSPGIVVTSDTSASVTADRRTRTSSKTYSANIRFQYQANGRDYTTDTLHFGQTVGSGDSSDAELRHDRYPVGGRGRGLPQPERSLDCRPGPRL